MKMQVFSVALTVGMVAAQLGRSYKDLPSVDVDQFSDAQTFTQKSDHFDSSSTATFAQRYWTSTQYMASSDPHAPLFVYICGNERCEVPSTKLYPFMIGAAYGAEFLVIEHRFYGDSQVTNDWSTENLSDYLNA